VKISINIISSSKQFNHYNKPRGIDPERLPTLKDENPKEKFVN
jgi:hypothetical protein